MIVGVSRRKREKENITFILAEGFQLRHATSAHSPPQRIAYKTPRRKEKHLIMEGADAIPSQPFVATSNPDFALHLEKERRVEVPRQLRRRMSRLRRESLAKLEIEKQQQQQQQHGQRTQPPLPAQTQVKIPEQMAEEEGKERAKLAKRESSFSLDLSSPTSKKKKRRRKKKKKFAPLGPEQKGFARLYDTKLQAAMVAEDDRVHLGPVPHSEILAARKARRQRLQRRRAELRSQSRQSTTVSNALGLISRHLRDFEKRQREEDGTSRQRAKIETRGYSTVHGYMYSLLELLPLRTRLPTHTALFDRTVQQVRFQNKAHRLVFYNRKRAQVLDQFKKSQKDWRQEIQRHREEDERAISYRMAIVAHARKLRNEKRRQKWTGPIGRGDGRDGAGARAAGAGGVGGGRGQARGEGGVGTAATVAAIGLDTPVLAEQRQPGDAPIAEQEPRQDEFLGQEDFEARTMEEAKFLFGSRAVRASRSTRVAGDQNFSPVLGIRYPSAAAASEFTSAVDVDGVRAGAGVQELADPPAFTPREERSGLHSVSLVPTRKARALRSRLELGLSFSHFARFPSSCWVRPVHSHHITSHHITSHSLHAHDRVLPHRGEDRIAVKGARSFARADASCGAEITVPTRQGHDATSAFEAICVGARDQADPQCQGEGEAGCASSSGGGGGSGSGTNNTAPRRRLRRHRTCKRQQD